MQVCRRGRASIVLLFGFHSVHSSTEEQNKGNAIQLSKQMLCENMTNELILMQFY